MTASNVGFSSNPTETDAVCPLCTGTRVVVAVCALGLVLALAQLTVYLLMVGLANVTPYAGP